MGQVRARGRNSDRHPENRLHPDTESTGATRRNCDGLTDTLFTDVPCFTFHSFGCYPYKW